MMYPLRVWFLGPGAPNEEHPARHPQKMCLLHAAAKVHNLDLWAWTHCRKLCWEPPSVRWCWENVWATGPWFGAVAGTLPDMDVLGQYFLNELDNLAFHRGISHSLLASVLGSLVFGRATHQLYQSRHHATVAMAAKAFAVVVVGFVVNFLTQILSPGGWLPLALYIPAAAWLWWRHGQRRYFSGQWERPDAELKGWVLLFFWGFVTHIVLDCFTTYGTQVFAPFSDQRVAWGTIAVADPLYTAPFLICLLVAARFARDDRRRGHWNVAGLGLSSLYMAFTVVNHSHVSQTIESPGRTRHLARSLFHHHHFQQRALERRGRPRRRVPPGAVQCVRRGPVTFHPISKGTTCAQPRHGRDLERASLVQRGLLQRGAAGRWHPPAERPAVWDVFWPNHQPDDYIFRFKLTDLGPDENYGFERAQGGPPNNTAEDMMRALWKRGRGLREVTP